MPTGHKWATDAERIAARKKTKREHYLRNREQKIKYAAEYRAANAQRIRESAKHAEWSARYREKNYEKCLQMTKAWKDSNPEQRKKTQAEWLQNNLEKHRTYQHNRRARKNQAGGSLSPDLAERLYAAQKGKCACCRRPLNGSFDMDHIVPLALGGSNTDDNIQLLTKRCNRQKGAKPPVEFMQSRGWLI
jgi:5-methylcytosine-specific restriction endonuclease McrA